MKSISRDTSPEVQFTNEPAGFQTATAAPAALDPQTGTGFRVMVYSHDTFGLGHLRRCLKISEALTKRYPGLSILVATGSPLVNRFEVPPGVDFVKLPSVRKTGREHYEARILQIGFDRILDLRSRLLLETAQAFEPHFLLVDHSPSGMKGEMLKTLQWLRDHHRDTTTILGLRDILDDPTDVRELWQRTGIYDLLENAYDRILVYGSPSVYDPVEEYGFTQSIRAKTQYCNYIAGGPIATGASTKGRINRRPHVLVTVGGGDGAADTVIEPYLAALRRYQFELDFDTTILTGPFISDEHYQELMDLSESLPVTLKRFVPNTRPLLEQSELVICTAGYNTMTEILGSAKRAIVIPRILHRKEQLIRAQRLAEMGLVTFMHPDEVTSSGLHGAITAALGDTSTPLVKAREDGLIPFDGCDRIVDSWGELMTAACRRGGDAQ